MRCFEWQCWSFAPSLVLAFHKHVLITSVVYLSLCWAQVPQRQLHTNVVNWRVWRTLESNKTVSLPAATVTTITLADSSFRDNTLCIYRYSWLFFEALSHNSSISIPLVYEHYWIWNHFDICGIFLILMHFIQRWSSGFIDTCHFDSLCDVCVVLVWHFGGKLHIFLVVRAHGVGIRIFIQNWTHYNLKMVI